MKILAILTLLLALGFGCLGYTEYGQSLELNFLKTQMSGMTQELDAQHQGLLSQKKVILGLRSSQKQSDKVLVEMYLYLKAQEQGSSPKTESNAYVGW